MISCSQSHGCPKDQQQLSSHHLPAPEVHEKTYQFCSPTKSTCLQIVITADDLGYSTTRDSGVMELIKTGKVTNLSVIITGPDIKELPSLLADFKDFSIGLHFNLTEGQPLTSESKNSMLCQKGLFLGKEPFLNLNYLLLDERIVRNELIAQIQQFCKLFSKRPSHIDGHNHIHLIPTIASIMAEEMAVYGIARTRILHEQLVNAKPQITRFISLSKQSQPIYASWGIHSCQYFIGLDMIDNLRVAQVLTKCKQILSGQFQIGSQQNNLNRPTHPQTVQIMCHPGHSDPNSTSQFLRSTGRLTEMNQLLQMQFPTWLIPTNFDAISVNSKGLSVLIYSKMILGCGNRSTALRLRQIFRDLGANNVYLRAQLSTLTKQQQIAQMSHFVTTHNVTLLIGINLTNTAQIVSECAQMTRCKYILIVAGTDANEQMKNEVVAQKWTTPLKYAYLLVALSQDMARISTQFLNKHQIQTQIVTIPQSTNLLEMQSGIKSLLPVPVNLTGRYIVFPTSFRKVKDVGFLLEVLNHLIIRDGIRVLIMGPILDQPLFDNIKPKLKHVQYLGSFHQYIYCRVLLSSFLLINTSESEGQSCSILEAFQAKVPVLARKNNGNAQLITHKHNGLLFETPQQFLNLYDEHFASTSQSCQKMTQNAYLHYLKLYRYQNELTQYKNNISGSIFQSTSDSTGLSNDCH